MIAIAIALLVVPGVMMGFSQSLEALLFWRFVQGLLLPPIFAVSVAYIGAEWPAGEATAVTGTVHRRNRRRRFQRPHDHRGARGTDRLAACALADAAITAFCA